MLAHSTVTIWRIADAKEKKIYEKKIHQKFTCYNTYEERSSMLRSF